MSRGLVRQIRALQQERGDGILTMEEYDAKAADLSDRLLKFVDSLEFEPGWVFDWDLINGYLKWTRGEEPFALLDRSERYTCDRYEAVNDFLVELNNRRMAKLKKQFYFIFGEERASPYGLYQRLGLKEIPSYLNPSQEPLPPILLKPESDSADFNRVRLLRDLFSDLQLNVNNFRLEDCSFRELMESPIAGEEEAVVVGFKKYLNDWTPRSAELIDWFINRFCGSERHEKDPTFVFIFKIVYPKPEKGRHDRRTRRLIRSCRNQLSKIGNLVFLDELKEVRRSDINTWLEEHLERDYTKRQKLMDEHFGPSEAYHMSEVEYRLDRLIQEHNRKKYN